MKTVTDQTSNPFGMRPPFERQDPGAFPAVFGYGDANADFHVIGDHPGVHGGARTGVPFTDVESGLAIQELCRDLGFVTGPTDRPILDTLFWSYLHMCSLPDGRSPTPEEYAELERYFDAEFRAINAHILLPVGERATDHVLESYTTQRSRVGLDMEVLHAKEIRGRGFLVVPIRDPTSWSDSDRSELCSVIESLLQSDYRQTKGVATVVG